MSKIKIGIVENEMVIANSIFLTLNKLGYEVLPAAYNYNAAINMIDTGKPDLLLLDINLGGDKDGVDVAYYSKENHPVPIIFLTANSDANTVDRAKPVRPNAYLVKPFTKEDLYAAIEIAVSNHIGVETQSKEQESMLVKDGYNFVKADFKEILYLSSEQNYVTFHLLHAKKLMMRSTMQEMEERLPKNLFLRLSRGFIINVKHVSKIETNKVFIEENEFGITKPVHDLLLQKVGSSL
jgi:DNA-binding LytR/AlgR family response regulator